MASFDFAGALKSGATPQQITSFLSTKGQGQLAQTYFNSNPANPNTGNNPATNPLSALKNYALSVASDVKGSYGNAVNDLENSGTGGTKAGSGGFQAVGDLAEGALSPLTEAIKGIANGLAETKPVQAIANSGAGTAVAGAETAVSQSPVTTKLSQWAQQYPEAAKDLGALGNITALGTTIPAGAGAVDAIPEVAGKVADTVNAVADKVSSALPDTSMPAEAPKPTDLLTSRVADATPSYSKKMVGDFVQNPNGDVVPRINEGEGLTGNRTVTTSKAEAANGAELANIKDYPDNGTALEKSQAVYKTIQGEANGLKSSLAAEDKTNPLVADEAKQTIYKNVFDNMNGDARNAFISRGRGLEEKAGVPVEQSNTIVGRYGQNVADTLGKYDGTRQGILQLRQKLDSIYENARGKAAFGSDHRNALDEMHTSIRDYLNTELHDSTANTDVKASLEKQSKLFRAKDVLDQKAAAEATSKTGRFMQKHPQARFVSRMLERQAIRIPLEVAGVTAAGAAIRKAITK